ncbi:MAG TPA: TonB-dependent receptor [Bryobacteraceae bacterium]|nr:TonB-dependent receptor [Bryobacteraceae bacterium]HXR15989.1 TonB-dependent receptor [Terriglobales bacterium]HZW96198.1 TonB-dependent receptor [Candidatus Eremiobacteraceae bacterium]
MRIWLFAFVLVFGASLAWAQLYSGSVVGVVADPSGAVIPGAKVTLVDQDKGYTFNVTTDSTGRYFFRGVPPGSYKVTVVAQGFQIQTRTGIVMEVNQNTSVDLTLQLATGAQTVNITTEAPLLSTQDSVTSQVIDRKLINDLPNVDRDVMSLAYLTPGVVVIQNGGQSAGGNWFVSNGGREATADVVSDGISLTQFDQNSGVQDLQLDPNLDSVEEYKVQTSNFSAEFGFSGATIVNMITRSGTNEFHGSLHEAFRNNVLDANDYFDNAAGNSLPGLHRNQFGGTVGGPIKKNKTFFFFDYDGIRQTSQSTHTAAVPTPLERQGNFGELCTYNGGSFDKNGMCSSPAGQLWDPYSGVYNANAGGAVRSAYIPFNNMITFMSGGSPALQGTPYEPAPHAGNLIDPVAKQMLNYFPMPNTGGIIGTPSYNNFFNWIKSGANRTNNDQFDIKIDHRFSDKSLLSAKYSQQNNLFTPENFYGNIADSNSGPTPTRVHALALNWTYTFSPTILMTLSAGFVREWNLQPGPSQFKNLDPSALLGEPKYMDLGSPASLPSINIGDSYGSSVGNGPYSYYLAGQSTAQIQDTFSWVKGAHEIKFGGEVRQHLGNFANPGPTGGSFSFDYGTTSQDPNFGDGGDAMASAMTGFSVDGGGTYEIANWVSTENYQAGGYIQDNWKITKKLTLNLGLRYDITLPRTERYNRMNWDDPSIVSPLQIPGLPTLHGGEVYASPNNRTNYEPDYTNFQPRFGLSWQPLSKTVIRGGYGIFYSTSKVGAAGPGAWGYQGYVKDTPWITTYQNDHATPFAPLSNPWPNGGPSLPPGNTLGALNDYGGYTAWGPIKSLASTPYEETWSLGFQRELPFNMVAEGDYVGKAGHHLYFDGAGNLDFLGPQIEHDSAGQIAQLLTLVKNPFYGHLTDPNAPYNTPLIQQSNLLVPYPQFGGFPGDAPPWANSIYNAAQLRVEKRFSSGLEFLVNYSFSKSIDDSSATDGNIDWIGLAGGHLQDPNNLRLERSVSNYNATHVLNISHVYELPIGKGKMIGHDWNPVVNAIVGGWQVNGIWTFASGFPLTVGLTGSGSFSLPTYAGQGPDLVGRPTRNTGSDWLTHYFANPDVFIRPPHYTVSDAPRTLPWINRPGQENATLSLFKSFPINRIREGVRAEFRLEALNAFNHVQFSPPHTTVGSGLFGQINSQANVPRQVQLTLKVYF